MTKVVTIFTPKGGVGKTTIALHLGWMLSQKGSVAFVDADERAMLKDTVARGPENFPNISCYHFEATGTEEGDEEAIREVIDDASHKRDAVIVDCGGYMSMASFVAASVSDLVLIPITPDMKDLQQALDSYQKLELVSRRMLDDGVIQKPLVVRAVINNANTQTNAFAIVRAALQGAGIEMMECSIPTYTAIRDASFENTVVFKSRPTSTAATFMARFVRECEGILKG